MLTKMKCLHQYLLRLADFTQTSFNPLLDKLSFKNKNVIFLGDFSIDLLHYKNDNQARIFFTIYILAHYPHRLPSKQE